MTSTHKLVFINAVKSNQHMLTYCVTTMALMFTLAFQGVISGNLKAEYFLYALVVSTAFALWAVIEQKYRKRTDNE
ncbi:hypothetical protein [Acinetobacter sp. MD2]|uniref:hypothetical protein n=1 Tax=Acinetobacter sp. MD2 TaxID=2600066 RepID=UPI002D1E62C6|nr:hypothetical protein [Acinetobacter sp. MD2]MEB3766463.1 hypothetical protein [Acinetobacter sp. MD2]